MVRRTTELRPDEDQVNFLPRVRIPVLMLSGRDDSVFPYESSQVPFFRQLASPAGSKKQGPRAPAPGRTTG